MSRLHRSVFVFLVGALTACSSGSSGGPSSDGSGDTGADATHDASDDASDDTGGEDGGVDGSDEDVADAADANDDAAEDAGEDVTEDAMTDAGDAAGDAATDADADAEVVEVPVGEVTVTYFNEGSPQPGAHVAFHDLDGTIRSTAVTDASGNATAEIQEGGGVTFAIPVTGMYALTTIWGLQIGDTVPIGPPEEADLRVLTPTPDSLHQVMFDGGFSTMDRVASAFTVNNGCGRATATGVVPPTATIDFHSDCVDGGTLDLAAWAADSDGEVIGFMNVLDIHVSGNSISTMLPPIEALDRTQLTRTFGVENAPIALGVSEGQTVRIQRGGHSYLVPGADGFAGTLGMGETTTVTRWIPSAFADSVTVDFTAEAPTDAGGSGVRVEWYRREEPVSGERIASLGAIGWTHPDSFTFDETDPEHAVIGWTWTPGDRDADRRRVMLRWRADVRGEDTSHLWYIFVPPDATSTRLPDRPEGDAPFTLSDRTTDVQIMVTGWDADIVDGWDSHRTLFGTLTPSLSGAYETLRTGGLTTR